MLNLCSSITNDFRMLITKVIKENGNKIIEAHGTFRTAYCQACNEQYDLPWLKKEIFNPDTNDGVPKCHKCKTGIVRPDIVFFGEKLPTKFWNSIGADFRYGLILF